MAGSKIVRLQPVTEHVFGRGMIESSSRSFGRPPSPGVSEVIAMSDAEDIEEEEGDPDEGDPDDLLDEDDIPLDVEDEDLEEDDDDLDGFHEVDEDDALDLEEDD